MKRLLQMGAAALTILSVAGCVAVKVTQPTAAEMRPVSEATSIVRSEVSGIEPSVRRGGNVVNIKFNLLGKFDLEKRTVYASPEDRDGFIAIGFFPGVMSCTGEYGDCLLNGTVAFFYGLIFAGLPTVYGLIVEPFVPYYPEQTRSIVGQKAFLKSALIGVSRYSKPTTARETEKVNRSTIKNVRLEDAVISAPDLGIESELGQPLQIPVDKLVGKGDVRIKLRLPEGHPLKGAMSDFEDIEITVQCIGK